MERRAGGLKRLRVILRSYVRGATRGDAQRAAAVNLQLNPHSGGEDMSTVTTRSEESTAQPLVQTTPSAMPTLYLSLELGTT